VERHRSDRTAAEIVVSAQTIVSRQLDINKDPAVVTFGVFNGGQRFNIVPDHVDLQGTVRAFDPKMREQALASLRTMAEHIAAANGATIDAKIPTDGSNPVNFNEPGLTYSPELIEWIHELEIPNVVTDTLANEVTVDPSSGVVVPLHAALMRNLGISLTEIAWMDELASDCAEDGRYEFLYVAAPLKVVGGSAAPVPGGGFFAPIAIAR